MVLYINDILLALFLIFFVCPKFLDFHFHFFFSFQTRQSPLSGCWSYNWISLMKGWARSDTSRSGFLLHSLFIKVPKVWTSEFSLTHEINLYTVNNLLENGFLQITYLIHHFNQLLPCGTYATLCMQGRFKNLHKCSYDESWLQNCPEDLHGKWR